MYEVHSSRTCCLYGNWLHEMLSALVSRILLSRDLHVFRLMSSTRVVSSSSAVSQCLASDAVSSSINDFDLVF